MHMNSIAAQALLVAVAVAAPAALNAQQVATYRSAVVALTDDAQLRKRFEDDLAATLPPLR